MNFCRYLFLFGALIFVSSCSHLPIEQESEKSQPTFFVTVPITKFSGIQCPCIDIKMEDRTYTMELDLGFRGDISLSTKFLDEIKDKTLLGKKTEYGVRGVEYLSNLYRIPKANIGKMIFHGPRMSEETDEFRRDATFLAEGVVPSEKEAGTVGWKLFYSANLLIDTNQSRIAFCDSLETLKLHGYPTEQFVSSPLLLDRGLLEFETETSEGVLKCFLDTGCTWNILNAQFDEGISLDAIMWNPDNAREFSSLKINGVDFGPAIFHRFPIRLPIHIGGILGMEFVENHIIFIDFKNRKIYFYRDRDQPEPGKENG